MIFVTSCIDHLENTGSMRYADLPHVDTFQYIISKNHMLIRKTTNLIRKVFKYQKAVKLMKVDTSFLKFSFLSESLNFITGNKLYSVGCFP